MASSKMSTAAVTSPYYQQHLEWIARLKQKLWLVPFTCAIVVPLTFLIPYLFAIRNDQIDPIFPFISDSGSAGLPSSHIFSSLLDCLAILWLIASWVRYKQVTYYLTEVLPASTDPRFHNPSMLDRLHRMNKWGTTSMILVAFGSMMVGNFRSTEELIFHNIGVALVLTHLFIAYPCMIYLGIMLNRAGLEPAPHSIILALIIGWLSAIGCIVSVIVSFPGEIGYKDPNFRLRWPRDDPKFWWHVAASIFEWILMSSLSINALAMARRMRRFKLWDRVDI